MKQTLKGMLCSALVCPGAGHFALRAPKRGLVYALLSVGCVIFVIWALVPLITGLANEIATGNMSADPVELHALVQERMMDSGAGNIAMGIRAFIAVWIVALIDVFFLGRKRDRQLKENPAAQE